MVIQVPKLNTLGVPTDILRGEVKGFRTVHFIYKKVLYETLMAVLQKSFYDRAYWDTDDFGQKWPALHRMTDEIKLEEIASGGKNPQITGEFTNKRQLSPSQLKEYKEKFRQVLEVGKKGGSIRQAGRKSLQGITLVDLGTRVSFSGDKQIPRTPINIRTSRLAAALSPGEVAGNRIYGGPDQDFRLDGLNVHFSMDKIPYASEVEEIKSGSKVIKRPIITDAHIGAVFAAHKPAINAAKTEYNRILMQMERNNDRGQANESNNR
jgi:hypothetical protein